MAEAPNSLGGGSPHPVPYRPQTAGTRPSSHYLPGGPVRLPFPGLLIWWAGGSGMLHLSLAANANSMGEGPHAPNQHTPRGWFSDPVELAILAPTGGAASKDPPTVAPCLHGSRAGCWHLHRTILVGGWHTITFPPCRAAQCTSKPVSLLGVHPPWGAPRPCDYWPPPACK